MKKAFIIIGVCVLAVAILVPLATRFIGKRQSPPPTAIRQSEPRTTQIEPTRTHDNNDARNHGETETAGVSRPVQSDSANRAVTDLFNMAIKIQELQMRGEAINRTRQVVCPRCGGTGQDPNSNMSGTCPTCGGTGLITPGHSTPPPRWNPGW